MLPAGSKAGGNCLGVPDVCKVPSPPSGVVPVPFPNTGMVANALQTSMKVKLENMDAVVETSQIPNSDGDQPGVAGGVVSSTTAMKVVFRLGSTTVKAEGKGMTYVTSLTAHNGDNANMPAGLFAVPSQAKILVRP